MVTRVGMRTGRACAAAAAAALLALAACSSGSKAPECKMNEEYRASGSIPALKVPEDLDKPSERERLQIPSAAEDAPPAADECLERPPDYFGRPL